MNYVAFDDGYFPVGFKSRRGYTIVLGVKTDENLKPTAAGFKPVLVDAGRSEDAVIELGKRLGGGLLLLDGVTYSGFDIVDPWRVYESTGQPVVVVQYGDVDLQGVVEALTRHFPDGHERLKTFLRAYESMKPLETPWRTIRILPVGVDFYEAAVLVRAAMVYSPIPEPLRIAHNLASALTRLLYHRLSVGAE
ncbi:hypothetical protein TCELL_0514 [Thermogladius calderae 1633]|uniref:UPF0215 protein TCELL_0514 n=1 Tax=Thermogladius calderae (strain DSM 22663 / VKM B-2946 / 1633) TaxID=1184251 RepID=I3TDV1_THEC1|nr:DUF99 family protein [Thermogladius calderae]AFK50939.1 hypothetical protein TCELL_0514 [Thermogladius calderae 1633]